MKWKQYVIHTRSAAEEAITELLSTLGIDATEVRDHMPVMETETMALYKDVMPEQGPDDGEAEIVFYTEIPDTLSRTEEAAEEAALLQKVSAGLDALRPFVDIGSGKITESITEDEDFVNRWKEHFAPFFVEDLLICPTWCTPPEGADTDFMVRIDPGTAFGTGTHETTQLCLRGLRKYLKPGDRVLDVGTGSGILGIVSLKLGASAVFGTDIDPLAVETARENIELNGYDEAVFPVVYGNILEDDTLLPEGGAAGFDVVVSNILADVVILLQDKLGAAMKQGSFMILSGIINTKADEVRAAVEKNPAFEILGGETQGEWVSFYLRRV
ncbi:MAG: 50S ribosomal protein L11 methyltransferase [Lachnospiraceae bacterium]|nr:50S ribosomal protein L11 methyltransferase [Lachnospiraceae bacterium]